MLYLLFFLQTAIAEQLAIYVNETALQSEKQPELDPSVEKVLWKDVQQFPLHFHGITPNGPCVGISKTNNEINASLDKVVSTLNYLELEKTSSQRQKTNLTVYEINTWDSFARQ